MRSFYTIFDLSFNNRRVGLIGGANYADNIVIENPKNSIFGSMNE